MLMITVLHYIITHNLSESGPPSLVTYVTKDKGSEFVSQNFGTIAWWLLSHLVAKP